MKINRLELITKLEAMIGQREASAKARHEEALNKAAGAERVYLDERAGDWGAFATTIRTRLRQARAITMDDVPDGLRGGQRHWPEVRVFSPPVVKDSDYLPRTEALINLLAVLEASPDEFVTDSAMARIGAPLKDLMRP